MTTSDNFKATKWRTPPSFEQSNDPSLSTWSAITSHHEPFIHPPSPDSSPHSQLEIRTRATFTPPPSQPTFQQPQLNNPPSIIFRKRLFSEVIDLTIDDDDPYEPSERKRSRSSSHSTEASKPVFHPISSRPIEKSTDVHLSNPGLSSTKSIAVIVPSPQPSPEERRQVFDRNGLVLKNVFIVKTVDNASLPLDFQFITESILGDEVQQVPEDFMIGCKCRKDNGRQMGCEYLSCECLDDLVNSEGKKQFPYSQAKSSTACLRDAFINGRNHIYECNRLCNCGSNCKNRVVQHGRKVGLEIFKTINRGWGLRCTEDLKRGQFIDTYRGEIITHDEANRRGEMHTADREIYLMGLDKFTEEDGGSKYVCDGLHFGGPTRFINHSCDPNCAIYTVSYNHADNNIYDLAFFATEPIPAGTELTFNYVDDDKTDIITEEKADEMLRENGYRPAKCLCGSARCRGYFFT